MSYLLEFPPTTLPLPDDVRQPPYVIFAINNVSMVEKLPSRIPLKAVVHFIPKLAQYVLPVPEDLPADVAKGVLRTPYVGIDIALDIGIASFQRIILKVLQSAGMAVPKHQLQLPTTTITSVSIRKSWLLLELHPAGLDALMIHLQTRLINGSPVTLVEIQALWAHFPSNSEMLRLMAINFVQSQVDFHYHREDFNKIRSWYLMSRERRSVFQAAEALFPEFGKMSSLRFSDRVIFNRMPLSESRRKTKEREDREAEEAAALSLLNRRMEVLEMKAKKIKKAESAEDVKKTSKIRLKKRVRSAPELKDGGEGAEQAMLQPTVYDPSQASA
ncbi:hypothetical protein HBI56_018370 [Parastagonospora nodorum]|uniref:Uncharacterized protein n=2 Tax=Phaeosphaeria nodorum (strain SN15 / ATCC MYA-4574 / FGSC 10173) TaxID=321614 RepID=A0A7U2I243_PHANO|nr:hypothetical protein SNOG_01500 [Parastagonospora nodorum SN15]KAH3914889.1 hypothetical protein HBH56_081600 [Parastagonospora nodorum]EAT91149.1 hypothetical protein SNOG_01500 [Parastagonospora nodorum SN15]KAH3929880.1 hypothetical protein HBH54_120230 [Parastagonospora nodorum]KAH3976869.1 hypothetical protein HBH51_077180 [Parastagonospora nodorum]KAH4069063.1 hypothetical protein HBH50_108240 [Parastagonospora nodorum]